MLNKKVWFTVVAKKHNWLHLVSESMKYSENGTTYVLQKLNVWSREKFSSGGPLMVNFLFHLSRFSSAWLHEKPWEDLRRKEQDIVPLIWWKQLLSSLSLFCISSLCLFFMVRDMTFIYTTLSIVACNSIVLIATEKNV